MTTSRSAPTLVLALLGVLATTGCASDSRERLPDVPPAAMLPPGVNPAHLHFTVPAVHEGELALPFALPAADGTGRVALSGFRGMPLVLVFGSCTRPPFRHMLAEVERMKAAHAGAAEFLMVYVREAHPTDEWRIGSNDREGWSVAQPRTLAERMATARAFAERVGLTMPLVVDDVDDAVSIPYGGWPGRFYVLDGEGRVLYRSEVGPFGFRPAELEDALGSLPSR